MWDHEKEFQKAEQRVGLKAFPKESMKADTKAAQMDYQMVDKTVGKMVEKKDLPSGR